MKKDKRVDAYIAKSQPFAGPILKKLRRLVHKGIPEIEETIKWGMPFFVYQGIICFFAAFKEHAAFGFWKYRLINDPDGYLQENANKGGEGMGNFGRLKNIKDLPPNEVIIDFLKQAKKLNEEDTTVPAKKQNSRGG